MQDFLEVIDEKPDLILLTETFGNETVTDASWSLAGYELVARRDGADTASGRARGLIIYAKEGLGAARVKIEGEENVVEVATVELSWGGEEAHSLCCISPTK